MPHIMTQREWEEEVSEKILQFVRNEIYMDLRYLDNALSALKWSCNESMLGFATDGENLYYSGEWLIRVFQSNSGFLNRAYLHTVLHCIYSHLFIRQNRNKQIWDISCDIMTEYTIDMLDKSCTRRALRYIRLKTYEELKLESGYLSAAGIYRQLCLYDEERLNKLAAEFYTDSHVYWPEEKQSSASQQKTREKWDKIARKTDMELELNGTENASGERIMAEQLKAQKGKRSYRDFLRKFAVLREEMHCDPDEFDLNYYTYGLKLYGNMPLIEPMETREIMKIQEFVVAVDTSYSTSGELIKNFLKETFSLLMEQNSFFQECRIHIIQCDEQVKRDDVITDIDKIDEVLNRFTIEGGGGTDFRPVFRYVDELMENGVLKNLKGLLYFTDGRGIYPKKRPKYKTAFLFLDDYENEKVPAWAMRLKLNPEEFYSVAGDGKKSVKKV
ncbi:MAG: metallopeptidase [Lachnospiraceae bacterium]|nr:metallopeptidase [Lachnospiraceae bacterium]